MTVSRELWVFTILMIMAIVPVRAEDRVIRMQVPPEVARGMAAMPLIAEPVDDAEVKINMAVRRLDAAVRKAAVKCKKEGGGHSSWERSVNATMLGPRYLSYQIIDDVFCGGAHPNLSTMAIVYDLANGAPVDWTSLLPASLTGEVALQTGADGTKMVTLASSLYAKPETFELLRRIAFERNTTAQALYREALFLLLQKLGETKGKTADDI